jgi:hypothetical protein
MNSLLTHKQYQRLIAPRVHLWWGVGDKRLLSKEVVVEAILSRGNWEDVLTLIDEWGIHEVKQIFDRQTTLPRTNYRPQTVNFFRLYFDRHA